MSSLSRPCAGNFFFETDEAPGGRPQSRRRAGRRKVQLASDAKKPSSSQNDTGRLSLNAPGGRKRRATIKDVAAQVGVSSMTVSRAINGRKGLRPETRAAILAAA